MFRPGAWTCICNGNAPGNGIDLIQETKTQFQAGLYAELPPHFVSAPQKAGPRPDDEIMRLSSLLG